MIPELLKKMGGELKESFPAPRSNNCPAGVPAVFFTDLVR